MLRAYTPHDWFWHVGGDASRAWSSAAGAYVETWDAVRLTRIDTEAALADVLAAYSLPGPLKRPRSVHKAWFKAALNRSGHLNAVDTFVAALPTEKQILWSEATEISEADADVIAVAAALKIDLAAVFDEAEALRDARDAARS